MASSVTEQFSGKVVVVTGSSSGIGEAIALNFAKRGAKVTICGRDITRLQEVTNKCTAASGGHRDRFLTVSGDLRNQGTRSQIINNTVAQFGQLDILVCNAGVVNHFGTISEATEEIYDHIFDVNTKSVFFLIQTALPHLENSKGNIVTISFIISHLPSSSLLVYPMSKAAVDHLTNCLALDLAPKGIRVNTVNPSYVITRVLRYAEKEDETSLQKKGDILWRIEETKQPYENRLVTVEEVSEAVTFLASDKASFITGQHLNVDGGRALTGPFLTRRMVMCSKSTFWSTFGWKSFGNYFLQTYFVHEEIGRRI